MMMDYSVHKVSFLNLLHQKVFENFRLFFIQLIFMYEVWKCPKHRGSESFPLLRHCRDPMEFSRLPEISKFLKSEMATLSQLSVWLMGYIPFPHPKGDKNKIAKICWNLLIMYSKTTWPISSKLGSECL